MDLLDVYLATGGYPRLVSAARAHPSAQRFVRSQLDDDQSPLSITGLRLLDAEFREDLRARNVGRDHERLARIMITRISTMISPIPVLVVMRSSRSHIWHWSLLVSLRRSFIPS